MIEKEYSISVITVTFNCENLIEKTIQSVLNQKNIKLDFIIVDGLSSDKTIEIINKYNKHITTFISEKDQGIADAMNNGIKHSKAQILTFLNAGDYYTNENVLNTIIRSKNKYRWEWCYGFPKLMINNKITKFKNRFREFNKNSFLYSTPCNHQCCFFSKYLFEKYGNYNLSNDHLMDIDFFLRLVFNNVKPKVIKDYIVWYDTLGHSTKNLSLKNFYERILLIKKYTSNIRFFIAIVLISIFYFRRILSKYFKIAYSKLN